MEENSNSGQIWPTRSTERHGPADRRLTSPVDGPEWHWVSKNAQNWSVAKLKEMFSHVRLDTSAGVFLLNGIEKCEGDAGSSNNNSDRRFMVQYEWDLWLKWKGKLQDSGEILSGIVEVANFTHENDGDPAIHFRTESSGREDEELMLTLEKEGSQKIIDELKNYVGLLREVLRGAKQPNKHNIWPGRVKSNSTPIEVNESQNELQNPAPAHIDIFQEREGAGGMRVGRDFQAKIPVCIPLDDRNVAAESDKALLVWSPSEQLSDDQIEKFLDISRDKYQYSGEQALGLLFWHRYDVTRALHDLGNFTPHPEEWTVEDKVLFEQAFQFHGKAFDKIRQMLPDKSMSNLIRYYYKWKKVKNKTSVMDRQTKKISQDDEESGIGIVGIVSSVSHNNNNGRHTSIMSGHQQSSHRMQYQHQRGNLSDSESDDKLNGSSGNVCSNCGIPCTQCTELQSKDNMCNTCFLYWKKTGEYRPLTGPLRRGDKQVLSARRQRRSPPKGMYINHEDLNILARSAPQAENVTLQGLEKEVLDQKCGVQARKQDIELLKRKLPVDIGSYSPNKGELCVNANRGNSRWAQDEILLATQGMRRYGRNFQKIAEIIGTKTECQIKIFYASNRRRYNLDQLIQEYERENYL